MSPHPCQLTIFFLIRPSEQGTAGRHDLVESQSVDRYRSNSRRRKCAANLVVGYMSYKQYRTPFWRRTTPLPKRDILSCGRQRAKRGTGSKRNAMLRLRANAANSYWSRQEAREEHSPRRSRTVERAAKTAISPSAPCVRGCFGDGI